MEPASQEFETELARLARQGALARAAGGRSWANFNERGDKPMGVHDALNDQEGTLASSARRQQYLASYEAMMSAGSNAAFTELLLAHADRGKPPAELDCAAMLEEARTLKESCEAVEDLSSGRTDLGDHEDLRQRTVKAAIWRGPGADIGVTLTEAIADPTVGTDPPPPAKNDDDALANVDQLLAESRALTERIRREHGTRRDRHHTFTAPLVHIPKN
jgi:hypothetical protein